MIPSRLLMTADAVGGVWTYALDLARALGPLGVRTTLAVMGPAPTPDQRRDAAAVPSLTLVELDRRLEWMDDPWRDVDAAGEELLALSRDVRPEVVHLNGYAHAALPFGVPTVVVAHSCVGSWWRAVLGADPPARLHEYRRRVRRGLQAADAVVTPTRAFLSLLDDLYGPSRLGLIVPNGVRHDVPPPSAPKEKVVLAAGRVWDRAKNLAILDQVAPRIPWPVRVAGDPTPPEGAPVHLRHVTALGRLSREALRGELARASVFCHPARYEPFGLGPLEAAVAGCALVLGDLPTLREIWRDAALYVPPDDPDAIARALRRLTDDPELVARYAARARRRAARFDVATQALAYRDVYQLVLAARTFGALPARAVAREVSR